MVTFSGYKLSMMTKYPISAVLAILAPRRRWKAARRTDDGAHQAGRRKIVDLERTRRERWARRGSFVSVVRLLIIRPSRERLALGVGGSHSMSLDPPMPFRASWQYPPRLPRRRPPRLIVRCQGEPAG